jgi:Ca2+/H+ antiporter
LLISLSPSFAAGNFCKAKDKESGARNDHHVIKAAKEISMQYLILLAAVSMIALYALIIVGCLGYVGRHGHRTS